MKKIKHSATFTYFMIILINAAIMYFVADSTTINKIYIEKNPAQRCLKNMKIFHKYLKNYYNDNKTNVPLESDSLTVDYYSPSLRKYIYTKLFCPTHYDHYKLINIDNSNFILFCLIHGFSECETECNSIIEKQNYFNQLCKKYEINPNKYRLNFIDAEEEEKKDPHRIERSINRIASIGLFKDLIGFYLLVLTIPITIYFIFKINLSSFKYIAIILNVIICCSFKCYDVVAELTILFILIMLTWVIINKLFKLKTT